jgi:hypothetical protein
MWNLFSVLAKNRDIQMSLAMIRPIERVTSAVCASLSKALALTGFSNLNLQATAKNTGLQVCFEHATDQISRYLKTV